MKIWLVTTGSSDVQLKTNDYWDDWYRLIKPACHRLPFEPTQAIRDSDDPYRIAPRVLGMAYQACPDEVWGTLEFPLLKEFTAKLKDEAIAQIILLVTDQSQIFDETQREDLKCPYWQDTCELQPIFENYFKTHLPDAELVPLKIAPQPGQPGLDNWNFVLDLVRSTLKDDEILVDPTTVYISHQAGTPAISSAVQFSGLAQFGDRVKFLVSNEYDSTVSEPLEGSSYLRGIRIQEAKALLDSHNYSGVATLVKDYLKDDDDTEKLLRAAIEWNVAKFDTFLEKLKHSKFKSDVEERTRAENWWWIAYEEVYLALVRKKQDNIVEAFFHSFRAFEYIFSAWSDHEFGIDKGHIEKKEKKLYLKDSVLSDAKDYFSKAKFKQNGDPSDDLAKLKCKIKKENKVLLDLSTIYKLFRACRSEYKTECLEIEIFWDERNNKENNVSEKRNSIFHQVQGMSESDLWSFWGVSSPEEWESRLLEVLNFIAKEDFPEGFKSLKEASLMVKVHQELKDAIAQL